LRPILADAEFISTNGNTVISNLEYDFLTVLQNKSNSIYHIKWLPKTECRCVLAQARAYDDLSTTQLGDMLKQAQTAQLSHAVPVLCAREIDRWASSKDYECLLGRNRSVYY
jgi:hypothetical protein